VLSPPSSLLTTTTTAATASMDNIHPVSNCTSKGKTLYLIRHAQSTHNAYAEQHSQAFSDPYLFDAVLSPLGSNLIFVYLLKRCIFSRFSIDQKSTNIAFARA
jgi:hypothetical protein